MSVKHGLQNIISGNGSVRHGKIIQSITDYLGRKKKAVSNLEEREFNKDKETQVLKFITDIILVFKYPISPDIFQILKQVQDDPRAEHE